MLKKVLIKKGYRPIQGVIDDETGIVYTKSDANIKTLTEYGYDISGTEDRTEDDGK